MIESDTKTKRVVVVVSGQAKAGTVPALSSELTEKFRQTRAGWEETTWTILDRIGSVTVYWNYWDITSVTVASFDAASQLAGFSPRLEEPRW